MPSGSLSLEGLQRVGRGLQGYVDRGETAGIVALIDRGNGTCVEAVGVRDLATGAPMRSDTIFRITSMTKPIAAVAALILVEETRLRLDEPVDRLLPELAGRRVLRSLESPFDDTVPAKRPIALRDLLTFRAGLGMIWAEPGTYPIQAAIAELGLGPGPLPPSLPPDELMARVGRLPLVHQPGERWLYHTGYDILGVLVARAAGVPLEDFLRERIFSPLGMRDTGFTVPAGKLDRLATQYQAGADGVLAPFANDGGPAIQPSGSTGLFSTGDDYLLFAHMLLRLGRHGAARILARTTVEAMTTDQITPEQKAVSPFFPGFWDSTGWGFGVGVAKRRDGPASVPGSYGWDGGFGTAWTNDPKEDLVAILMTQRLFDPVVQRLHGDFRTLAYAALDG